MKKSLSVIIFFITAFTLLAQERVISVDLKDISFRNAVDSVVKEVPVKIYYSSRWVDTLSINMSVENESLESVINRLMKEAGFNYFITDDGKVIVSGGYKIKTNFEREYLDFIRRRELETILKADDEFYYVPDASALEEELKLFRIGNQLEKGKAGLVALTGFVYDGSTNEPVPGATVFIDKLKVGAVTNGLGYYRLSVPRGQYQVEYRIVGMHNTRRNVLVYSSGDLDVNMFEKTNQLNEVTVVATRSTNILNKNMGMALIDVKSIRKIPLGLGEADLVKSTLLLPGIQTAGEAAAGFNVRGGTVDQNLVLIDNAPIINANHFFGFFSSVNSDIIQNIALYKGVVPAKFGGRIASVMDVGYRKPDQEKLKISGGISPVMGRLVAEAPIIPNKSSFIVSGRSTYSDWILKQLSDKRLRKSSAGFFDMQGLVDYTVGEKDYITLSGYYSNDDFDYYQETSFNYSNLASTVKWDHIFNNQLSALSSFVVSNYSYSMGVGNDSLTAGTLSYKLQQKILRSDFSWKPNDSHKSEFGFEGSLYTIETGILKPAGEWSTIGRENLGTDRGGDISLYFSNDFKASELLTITTGIRGTLFSYWGPRDVFRYNEGVPFSAGEINDTLTYNKGEVIGSYPAFNYRLSARYLISPGLAVKGGVHRMSQFLHMISNTTAMSPTDIWKLSDDYLKPRHSDQFSAGIYKTIDRLKIEASVEAYYKILSNVIDYKGGAQILMNPHLETDLLRGKGKAYGVEFMLEKNSGKVTGMVSYTYSRVFHKVAGASLEESINNGEYFSADTDKPNDFKFFSNIKLSRRMNFTTNFAYNTGRPITYPIGYYYFRDTYMVLYSDRNEYRIPDYARLDLAITINGNLKLKKVNHSSFTFSVYNVLGRRNPYSIYFRPEDGVVNGYRMSIFGQQVFAISYNFRILGNALGDF